MNTHTMTSVLIGFDSLRTLVIFIAHFAPVCNWHRHLCGCWRLHQVRRVNRIPCFLNNVLFLVNCSRDAPYYDCAVGAALAHDGHPCGDRRPMAWAISGMTTSRTFQVTGWNASIHRGVTCFSGKQHSEMNPNSQHHGNIHRSRFGNAATAATLS